jgi:hypothetical protein
LYNIIKRKSEYVGEGEREKEERGERREERRKKMKKRKVGKYIK